ncbi:hypothetical protein HJC23_006777 [Cyclotella cryptica]|uniref:J domain-containing protein n=1 Tax=Cyclotella cryptica TaxID=29204 RepID=A0ABD3NM98_9STRA|eukprot:CCRYP_020428-RA/>CCRYP_020428-RA protein AED:0.25 eAED:0.25 QI:0/-1/0/1/-1/1/1/0/248
MSSRVTNAIASRKARETLLRLLFTTNHGTPAETEASNHYSYTKLRAAYLAKVHAMHPDKLQSRHRNSNNNDNLNESHNSQNKNADNNAHLKFIELKNAWEEYDAIMKDHVKLSHHPRTDDASSSSEQDTIANDMGSFTLFGVGCSFADNPQEREYRNEIMEMACRGWIPSGSLSCGGGELGGVVVNGDGGGVVAWNAIRRTATGKSEETRLSDDGMFVAGRTEIGTATKNDGVRPKSLVQNIDKFKKR